MKRLLPPRPETLWCPNVHGKKGAGWSFPRTVEKLLLNITVGKRVLHLFGGRSRWGLRLDIDTATRPHVIGDAWLAPFRRDAFDVVILDPPYFHLSANQKSQLLRQAAFIAKERVIWFHTLWIYGAKSLPLERSWLVRVGDNCAIRCIQVFKVCGWKTVPDKLYFDRGPAMKYNKWLGGEQRLPLGAEASEPPREKLRMAKAALHEHDDDEILPPFDLSLDVNNPQEG